MPHSSENQYRLVLSVRVKAVGCLATKNSPLAVGMSSP